MKSPRRKRRWNSRHYPKVVTVRVSAEEHAVLTLRAALARTSASRYLATAGLAGKPPRLRETPPPSPEEKQRWEQLLWALHKLGTNVNQLAHATHRARILGRGRPDDRHIDQAARMVQALMRLVKERL